MATHSARLRALINDPAGTTLLGASGVFQARLIERGGFEAAYHAGGGNAGDVYGLSDTGLITATEMIESVARMADSIDIPLFCDADDGYGAPTNVYRTIRGFERAGAAGVHLEDQDSPKRCGHLDGKSVITPEQMVDKIRAATDARQDDDFVLVVRSDALAVEGLDRTIERCHRYVEAGADGIFIDAPTSLEQLAEIGSAFSVPTVLNVSTSMKTPRMTRTEAAALGFQVQLLANWLNFAALYAARETVTALRDDGDVSGFAARTITFDEYMSLADLDDAIAQEARYGQSTTEAGEAPRW